MDYNALTPEYWDEQRSRVESFRARIASRPNAVGGGRVVPESGDMPIGTGRRLKMAVMFLDISKFSARPSASEHEQELNLRVLSLFFSEMIRIVEDYGGVVEKNTGDGLMAYFADGDGNPAEVGCKRALCCALTMFSAGANLVNPIIEKSQAALLNFRICIDYGPVTIAEVGAARRFKGILAIGTTANIAAKFLAIADEGEILLGEDVLSQIPQQWRIQYVKLKSASTGFEYKPSGQPYRAFAYSGRWRLPQ